MKISCPSCEAKYSIGDDKVQSRLAKIRCRKCGVDIVIDGRVQPPTVTVGDAAAAAPAVAAAVAHATTTTGPSYTIDFGESDQRQMTLDEVISSYNDGYVTPETFVWADGMSDWTPLGQVTEIVDALNAAAAAPAPSAPASVPQPAVQPHGSTVPRASTAVAAKTTRTQGRGGADLFGSIAHAGSEEDMAQQASREPAAPQGTTGARNESSVLFSLSALTASAKPSSTGSSSLGLSGSGVSTSSSSKEDSGLIDLKALTSQATDASTNTVGFVAPAPLGGLGGGLGAPLGGGFGSPLGGAGPVASGLGTSPLGDYGGYPQKKNRTGLYILGGAGILAVAVVLGIALQPEPPPPVKVEAAPLPIPTREPEPIKITEAKAPATGEASASAAPTKAAPVGKWKAKKTTGATATGTDKAPSTGGGDTTPTTPKKTTGKCGCTPGDLGCAMRCAAKGG